MSVFVDTSALYAVLDRDDRFHRAAGATWTHLVSGDQRLVTTNYVLIESFALMQRRLGLDAARSFDDQVVPLLSTIWLDEADHRTALSALLAAGRRDLSLVDCASFQTMREARIRSAFTFDVHFAEQGFEVLPGS